MDITFNLIILTHIVEACSNNSSDDDGDGVNIILVTLMGISIIGLVISIMINVFLVVKHKKSRCVVTSIHSMNVAIVNFLLQI